jgi:phage terminase Nu1 subunit (DNA packaging protein)
MAAPTYPVSVIAKLLMLTERRVQQLAAEGSIPKPERGKYELAPTVQAYIRYLRDRSVGADMNGDDQAGAYKTRMLKAKTRVAEAEADQVDGALLRRSVVEVAWTRMISNMRARLLSIPSKIAPLVHSAPSIAAVSAALTSAIHEALEEISRTPTYSPAETGSPEGNSAVGDEGAEGGGAPTESDGLSMG